MRFFVVGIIVTLVAAAVSWGQAPAEGDIESIGIDGYYRPNCWVPMKLRLRPTIGEAATYKIQVVQEDMDRDRVLYTKEAFTLNGNPPGGKMEERVWVYFLPQPRLLDQALNAQALSGLIKVFLCDDNDQQIVQIPFSPGTPLPRNLDDVGDRRGVRLIALVHDSSSRPISSVYGQAHGLLEEIVFVHLRPSDLPGSVLGYSALDGVVWLNSDPGELNADSAAALEQYVRDGGKLVVCQNIEWRRTAESMLGPLLPVVLTGSGEEANAATLRELAGVPDYERHKDEPNWRPPSRFIIGGTADVPARYVDPWPELRGKSVAIAKAVARPGAMVNRVCETDPASPYLARWMVGHGMVAWIAQDLGDPALLSNSRLRSVGWDKIWDACFDWRNDAITVEMRDQLGMKAELEKKFPSVPLATDLSTATLGGMELASRGAALVSLAVVFFIGYWLVAGPGSYLFLQARRRAQYSWMAFGLCAIAATVLTVGIVKLVLRGSPQVRHVSMQRLAANETAMVTSQFGLYVPTNNPQTIALNETASKRASYVVPFPVHPRHLRDTAQFLAPVKYGVPVRERNSLGEPQIEVPYRSTLKKFQVRWIGTASAGIDGVAALNDGQLSGLLVNNTGRDLHSVYFVYSPSPAARDDMMLFLPDRLLRPAWGKGQKLDLADMVSQMGLVKEGEREQGLIGDRGLLNLSWIDVWRKHFEHVMDQSYSDLERATVLLSVFERLAPATARDRNGSNTRYELLRRAGRQFDASNAVACGRLLIIARGETDGPLPFPLTVGGDRVAGEGVNYYQFIVPLNRNGSASEPAGGESQTRAE